MFATRGFNLDFSKSSKPYSQTVLASKTRYTLSLPIFNSLAISVAPLPSAFSFSAITSVCVSSLSLRSHGEPSPSERPACQAYTFPLCCLPLSDDVWPRGWHKIRNALPVRFHLLLRGLIDRTETFARLIAVDFRCFLTWRTCARPDLVSFISAFSWLPFSSSSSLSFPLSATTGSLARAWWDV